MSVRAAAPADVPAIAAIIEAHARRGEMLSRSIDDIRRDLDDFVVCEQDGAVIACSSLVRYSPTLAEVRSLAVADGVKRNGWGSAMVRALEQRARETGIATLFALTRTMPFFEQLGFARYDKEAFPEKIWRDCRLCPVQDRCDEVAVAMELGEPVAGNPSGLGAPGEAATIGGSGLLGARGEALPRSVVGGC